MEKALRKLLEKVVLSLKKELKADFEMPQIEVTRTKDEQFGDYTTNVAMVLGKSLKKNPLEVAEEIAKYLGVQHLKAEVKVAKPGYLNFYLAPEYFQEKLAEINKLKNKFGDSNIGKGMKVNNEFISANPTGPLHLGNGRGGFYGDTLTQVLRKAGFRVVSEYYVNDAGEQLLKLGHSVLKDSEAVYAGEYIEELNRKFGQDTDVKAVSEKAAQIVLEKIIQKTVAEKMKIQFDEWISERKDLVEKGYVEKAIRMLEEKGLTFKEEGALWLRTTDFGDDKDRVLVKSGGQKTYFASDCGYIIYKMERGFNKLIEIWGADHHGYVGRFKAAAEALGFKGELQFLIVQLAHLVKDGQEVRMSKRAGNVIYIEDLIQEVGHDVTRFIFLMYAPDTHMNFDLGLAKEQSQKNPVFYVQYAHARICNILAKVKSEKLKVKSSGNLSVLTNTKEISLMKELEKFPGLVEEIAGSSEVHKLPHYAIRLADKFHTFYDECRVVDRENPGLTGARLTLVNAVRIVLAETLRLIGVSAPNKM